MEQVGGREFDNFVSTPRQQHAQHVEAEPLDLRGFDRRRHRDLVMRRDHIGQPTLAKNCQWVLRIVAGVGSRLSSERRSTRRLDARVLGTFETMPGCKALAKGQVIMAEKTEPEQLKSRGRNARQDERPVPALSELSFAAGFADEGHSKRRLCPRQWCAEVVTTALLGASPPLCSFAPFGDVMGEFFGVKIN